MLDELKEAYGYGEQDAVLVLKDILFKVWNGRKSGKWGEYDVRFIVIEDKETLQKLGDCRKPNQPFLPQAPLAIAVLCNTEKSDTWIEDGSIASAIMQLEAESLGLGSCWVQIRLRESNQGKSSEEYVRELLGVPKHMAILNIIVVGYPEERLPAHTLNEIKTERVHKEIY